MVRRKTRLIDAIHSLQPSRLTINYFKKEAENIQEQMEVMDLYLKEKAKPKPNQLLLQGVSSSFSPCNLTRRYWC